MPTVSLQDIRDAADERYGPLVVEGIDGGAVTLLNPARLSKEKRAELKAAISDEDQDEWDRLERIVKATAKAPADAKRLLAEFKGDVASLAIVLENYNKGAQTGEASPSAS